MSDKKNIERLFQEKFKDFEAVPQPEVWDRIEAELKKKKKRRVIPLWLKLSGTAAILLLGLMLNDGTLNSFQNGTKSNEVVKDGDDTNEKGNTKGLIPASKNDAFTEKSLDKNDGTNLDENTADKKASDIKNAATISSNKIQKNNAVASQENRIVEKNNTQKSPFTKKKNIQLKENGAIANSYSATKKANKNKKQNKTSINPFIGNKDALASQETANSNNNDKKSSESNLKTNTQKEASENILNDKNIIDNIIKSNTTSQIAFDTEAFEKQKKDSTAVATAEPNALEELLKEKEKETVTEAKLNRWQITSNVAPIYFSSASNGSPIDEQFADNSKEYEKNLSYGIGVNYALSKKWSVKGGVNKLTLGYNTNDIVYYAGLPNQSARSTNNGFAAKGSSIIIEDNVAQNMLSFDNVPGKTPGHINQTMGFIEVPLELSYKLLDRKFGIEIVGGMSTLFLNENSLSVVSEGMQASLGKASNLNDVSFSSNVGLGFKYRFWKSFEANIEPKFKYQLNTFTENSNGFKPYFIGIYSGINFNF